MPEHTNPQPTDPQQSNPPQSDAPAQPKPSRNQCRHVHLAGRRCGSPCLRNENFCYYHHTSRRPPKHLGQEPLDAVFTMLPIDDAPSIQLALADILARIATRSLDNKRSSLLLYGLQIASLNLVRGQRPAAAAGPNPHPAEVDAVIEDLELDPDLGPLAPVAEFNTEDEAHKGLIQRFMDHVARPPEPCKMCAYYEELERNRAEGRRLMAEVARRRSLGLPEYPIEPHQPYPSDAAWAAEEARQALAGPQKPPTQPPTNNQQPATQPATQPTNNNQQPATAPPPHAEDPTTPGASNPDPETWAKFAAHLPNLKASAEDGNNGRREDSNENAVILNAVKDPCISPLGVPHHSQPTALTTQNSQLILPTLHAVAESPTRKLCRTPTRTRRPKSPTPQPTIQDPTATPEPSAPTPDDLARRTHRLTRAFRHRYTTPTIPAPHSKMLEAKS